MQADLGPRRARAEDVLWRVGPDRVLVRRVGGEGLDLLGVAAMVWVALDEPREVSALVAELAELDPSLDDTTVASAVDDLCIRGLVVRVP